MTVGTDRRRVTTAAVVVLSASVPPFLVGALAPQLDADMPFGAVQVGVAMAVCYTVAGVLSPLAGRVVGRLGVGWSARATCALATLGLLGISAATAVWHVVAALVVVGLANAVFQPTSNELLAGVAPARQALAFGSVQAAIPGAALLAGSALAVTGTGVDWRVTIGVVALGTVAAQAVIGGGAGPATGRPRVPDPGHRTAGPSVRTSLVPLVVTGTLASAAATALPSFTATAGLAQGLSPFGVAAAQIAGSLGSVVVRIAAPVAVRTASRRARHAVVAGLVATGSLGLVLLLAGTAATFVAGAVLGFAFGWGWNGLYNQLVATSSPDRVATATGVTQTGVFLGGTAGPVLFAVIVDRTGFTAAWLTMAVLMAVAAVSALTGRPSPTTPVAAGAPDPRPVPERS